MCMFQPWENLDSLWQNWGSEEWHLPRNTESTNGGIKMDPETDYQVFNHDLNHKLNCFPLSHSC